MEKVFRVFSFHGNQFSPFVLNGSALQTVSDKSRVHPFVPHDVFVVGNELVADYALVYGYDFSDKELVD